MERLNIGIFGKTNSGKSSLLNAFTKQELAIVSDKPGTTTDPVKKAMEIHPLGPCMLVDTAGLLDDSTLGNLREEKTKKQIDEADIMVLCIAASDNNLEIENELLENNKEKSIVIVLTKSDEVSGTNLLKREEELKGKWNKPVVSVSSKTKDGIEIFKKSLVEAVPKDFGAKTMLGDLVETGDVVLLVMPQDKQAPKGRLILPQAMAIRELLDRHCIAIAITPEEMEEALSKMGQAPKLVITDSQVFEYVEERTPKQSMLTSFSVLLAAQKGDIKYFCEGVKKIQTLDENSKVLIAECCTHAPLEEDIGRVKIPALLRKRIGENLQIDVKAGFFQKEELKGYDLVIQCGACMLGQAVVQSRVDLAKENEIPMTNYGVTIAYLSGILEKVVFPL